MSHDGRDDLMSVGADGTLRYLGTATKERLARHGGHFGLLPSPKKVIWMRAVNNDGSAAVRIRLAGEINAPGAMCEVFAMLAQMGWRGELVVCETETQRSLFFEQGNVVGAETTLAQERLGAVMYRYGMLNDQDRDRVSSQVKQGARFGAASVELGIVNQETVYKCLRHQIEDIAYATFAVANGTFVFYDGFDPGRLSSIQLVSAQHLLMDGVTRMDEIRYFREKIPSDDYVPVQDKISDPPPDEYAATYRLIDGKRSIQTLGRLTGSGEFAVTKDIYGLIRSGHVQVRPPKLSGGFAEIVEITNTALAIVHREATAIGKIPELKRSLDSFASGAGTYDLLFQGAGPAPDGSLLAAAIVKNLKRFNTDEPETLLRQMLFDYASFAVFSIGSMLGPGKESDLHNELDPQLTQLKPANPQLDASSRRPR
jgi:uncharacterized protein DUF4388